MKTLIVIPGDLYIRNFVKTGAFSKIEGKDTYFVASDLVEHPEALKKKSNYLGLIHEDKGRIRVFRLLFFPYLTFAYSSKSSSFKYRTERLLRETRSDKAQLVTQLVYIAARLLGRRVIPFFNMLLGINKDFLALMKRVKPDIVLIPSSAFDVLGMDATTICKQLRVPTMQLINGWDNLSSKIAFPVNPDFLCVWGQQSIEFAQKIHGIDPTRVFPIGVPTFDEYFSAKKILREGKPLKSHYDFEYVLFAGCAVAFDELSALKIFEKTIEDAGLTNLKVIYRPHPWRLKRSCDDDFKPEKFKHVVLDKQMEDSYHKQQRGSIMGLQPSAFLPSLDYYPSLLQNARFVICPLSTMTLEALIFEKVVLTLVYNDGIHITSPHNLIKYDHFNGIENLDGVTFCKKKKILNSAFLSVYEQTKEQHKSAIMEQLRYFIHHDDSSYAERLKGVMDRLAVHLKGKTR